MSGGTSESPRRSRAAPTVPAPAGQVVLEPGQAVLIALMLFGGRRLPEIGRSLGTGMREFKDSITGHTAPEPSQQLAPPETSAPASQPTERENA